MPETESTSSTPPPRAKNAFSSDSMSDMTLCSSCRAVASTSSHRACGPVTRRLQC